MLIVHIFQFKFLIILILDFISISKTETSSISNNEEIIQPKEADINDGATKLCLQKNKHRNLFYYNHTPFNYLHLPTTICADPVDLLMYVQSALTNFDRRALIRQTFGSHRRMHGYNIKLLFVVGQTNRSQKIHKRLMKEIDHYHDIVQADFKDTYENLTLKHIVGLHWINYYCPQAKFISKSDDDVIVNPFNLVYYLFTMMNHEKPFLLGEISENEAPVRQKSSKWFVDNTTYPDSKYPHFTKGFGYVMSQNAIRPLLICSYYQNFLFMDDVFITGLVLENTAVKLINFNQNYRHTWSHYLKEKEQLFEYIFIVNLNNFKNSKWIKLWHEILEHSLFLY